MAFPSVTNTFSSGTTILSGDVNTNFQDLVNAFSDGTKDLSMSAATLAGTFTANGACTLGNASGDDITISGSLAATLLIKAATNVDIGDSTNGLRTIYWEGNNNTVGISASGSLASDLTFTLPLTDGSKGHSLISDGSGVLSFAPAQTDINAINEANYTILDEDGYGYILMTTGNSDRTVTLPAVANSTDRKIFFKKVDSGTGDLIIDTPGAETIDGAADFTLPRQYDSALLVADGTNWHVIQSDAGDKVWGTRNGIFTYQLNTAYNGGNATTLTTSKTTTGYDGYLVLKQLHNGKWRMKFYLYFTFSDAAAAYATFSINSVTAKNLASTNQAFAVSVGGGSGGRACQGSVAPNTGTFECWTYAGTTQTFYAAGEVELESKPNWAY